MKKWLQDECTCKNALLNYDRPYDLVRCTWSCISPQLYVTYRTALAVFFIVTVALMGVDSSDPKYFIYLTNWGYLSLTISLTVKCACSIIYLPWWKGRQFVDHMTNDSVGLATKKSFSISLMVLILGTGLDEDTVDPLFQQNVPVLLKISWFLSNMTTAVAIFITIIYWSILAPLQPRIKYLSVQGHLINSIAVILDVFLSAMPFRLLHFYQPLIFGCTYIVFNVIFWFTGGTDPKGNRAIYPLTNWGKLELAIPGGVVGGLVGITVVHSVVCGLAKLRQNLSEERKTSMVAAKSSDTLATDNAL